MCGRGFGGGFGDSGDLVGRLFWCFGLGVRWAAWVVCSLGCLGGYCCLRVILGAWLMQVTCTMVSCDGCGR